MTARLRLCAYRFVQLVTDTRPCDGRRACYEHAFDAAQLYPPAQQLAATAGEIAPGSHG